MIDIDNILKIQNDLIDKLDDIGSKAHADTADFFNAAKAFSEDQLKQQEQLVRVLKSAPFIKLKSSYEQYAKRNPGKWLGNQLNSKSISNIASIDYIMEWLELGTEQEFLNEVKSDWHGLLNRAIDRYLLQFKYQETKVRDLQSIKKLGEAGQRIATYFDACEEEYEPEVRTPSLSNLLSIKDDLLIFIETLLEGSFAASSFGAFIGMAAILEEQDFKDNLKEKEKLQRDLGTFKATHYEKQHILEDLDAQLTKSDKILRDNAQKILDQEDKMRQNEDLIRKQSERIANPPIPAENTRAPPGKR